MKKIILILFISLCFTLTSQAQEIKSALKDTILNLSDYEFKELEQKLVSDDPTFRFKFISENDVLFYLAAQKKRPQNFIWIDLIKLHFAGEKYNARQLGNENDRKILFKNSLTYLTESLKSLEKAKLTNSNDSVKTVYNYYLGILKEDIAFAAVETGEFNLAKQMAKEVLKNNLDTLSFNYGITIHHFNTILGRVALRENDLLKAKEYLIKSLDCSVSPQLRSFGLSYILAKELLELGEKDIVLRYLDLVSNLKANLENNNPSNTGRMDANQRKIDLLNKWKEEIKSGKIPHDPGWQ